MKMQDSVPMIRVNAPEFHRKQEVEVYNKTAAKWELAVVETVTAAYGSMDKSPGVSFVRWQYRAALCQVHKGFLKYQVATAPGLDIREVKS